MADYVYIKNYSKNGELAIHRHVFEDLAGAAVERVGAQITKKGSKRRQFKLFNPIKVIFHDNGQVEIVIPITLKKGVNAKQICEAIQAEVAESLLAYTESVPFSIHLKVTSID
ncbi:MAG: Asp23/Gls24 family envelope stress response protein [Bacilli bacterium]|nr:Asp23/Gls24 family envelope stress response protein [Bacilli bacterium]